MEYQYIEASGSLSRPSSGSSPAVPGAPGGGELPIWRGKVVPRQLCEAVPESLARECLVFPIAEEGEKLVLAAVEPDDIGNLDKLTFVLGRPVRLIAASRAGVQALIETYFGPMQRGGPVDSMHQERMDAAQLRSMLSRDALIAYRHSESSLFRHRVEDPSPSASGPRTGLDTSHTIGDTGVWFYVVEEGQRVLVRNPDGTMEVVEGPRRVWRGRREFQPMLHHVAHPGDYLIVRFRDGRQEHLAGPADLWFDHRIHQKVTCEEMLQVAAKEAVVVYSQKEGTTSVQRRIEYGPTLFMPRPGEWLHRFVWHASTGGSQGVKKVPKGLVFHKLWLMPDQMYHDVDDVRTSDDAVLTIRLMIFFELLDIDRMLETTHDPIGDFVNAATSDVVDFTGRHDFESFKRHTESLNELETYRQLTSRAAQCGYRINKVVYRGYGAPDRLQQMHDQAIEARTRLQLDRATEQQAQELESYKLESQMQRAGKRRHEQTAEVAHQLELDRQKQEAELRAREASSTSRREQNRLDAEARADRQARLDRIRREHLGELQRLGVDLTSYLTRHRADRVIELRGPADGATHLHIDPASKADGSA